MTNVLRLTGGQFFFSLAMSPVHQSEIWGPVEAVSANFSGDLKVAHGDSATDEPKKSGF